jgi:succinate dehydrogenase / fumarate reductase cytochrome b subunit
LYFFDLSLRSEASFDQLSIVLSCPYSKIILWVFSSSLTYHLLAGIRHMLMDMGYGEDLSAGRRSAVSVIVLAVILIALLGVWIW